MSFIEWLRDKDGQVDPEALVRAAGLAPEDLDLAASPPLTGLPDWAGRLGANGARAAGRGSGPPGLRPAAGHRRRARSTLGPQTRLRAAARPLQALVAVVSRVAPDRAYDGDPRRLARWRPARDAPPAIAVWEITLRCDLGCRHCGSRAGRARTTELDTGEALDLVRQIAALGVKEVTLIGGEFYLREDWDRIAAEISGRGMFCSIVSGARQMTGERIARAVAAGVDKISLSIDGLEDTHDAIRGVRGSWTAAVSAARAITAAGIDLSVNTQINRLTLPELPGVARMLADIGAACWMVILTAAMGRAADRPGLMLQPYHLLYAFPLLAEIKRTILDPAGIAFFPGNNVGYFGPYARELRYGSGTGGDWSGCAAGEATLGIEADGTVKGCPSLPTVDYAGGTARRQTLDTIWRGLRDATRDRPVALAGFCAGCSHAPRCGGGCTWTSHVLFGQPGNMPFCHHRALALAEEGVAETIHLRAPAPGMPFDFGRYAIVRAPLAPLIADDPVLNRSIVGATVPLKPGARSLWTAGERDAALAAATGPDRIASEA